MVLHLVGFVLLGAVIVLAGDLLSVLASLQRFTDISAADTVTITDVEGTTYVDLVQSYGAVILGHAHPAITSALVAIRSSGGRTSTVTVAVSVSVPSVMVTVKPSLPVYPASGV